MSRNTEYQGKALAVKQPRPLTEQLLKHFAKEFTKKTKTTLDLPCSESASSADKRAEAKLRLAIEHTKRSLSASSGAATCAVESLKDGLDLSTAINRMRFDSLALPVYRQVGERLTSIVKDAGLDLYQVDEILLAGASSLFPGLQSNLSQLVAPTTPVTAALDPSQVIAIGCALQALHLSRLNDGLALTDVLGLADWNAETLSAPIGIALPGDKGDALAAKLFEKGAPLPSRRRVALPVASGAEKVGLELWEGKEEVKITKVEAAPREKNGDAGEAEDEDEDDDEDEETKEILLLKNKFLGYIENSTAGAKQAQLEVIVQKGGKVEVRLWAEGKESEASKLEL